jgi:hypothetical protein
MLPNSTGVPLAAVALTCSPEPGVVKTAPRGELTLKKTPGKRFGADDASGTPSQLISRRPEPKLPTAFGFNVPRSVRKLVIAGVIDAASAPLAEVMTGAEWAAWARPRSAIERQALLVDSSPVSSACTATSHPGPSTPLKSSRCSGVPQGAGAGQRSSPAGPDLTRARGPQFVIEHRIGWLLD